MNRRNVIVSLAVVAMGFFAVATPAEAGGASKKVKSVVVYGNQGADKPANIVIFNSSPQLLKPNQSDAYYLSKGGAFVPAGKRRVFIVPEGAGTVYVVPNTNETWAWGPKQKMPYAVTAKSYNQYQVNLIGGDSANPTVEHFSAPVVVPE